MKDPDVPILPMSSLCKVFHSFGGHSLNQFHSLGMVLWLTFRVRATSFWDSPAWRRPMMIFAGVLRLFHLGLFYTVAPLCNSLRNDVASIETYSSWMNCPKEKCVSADIMHLFLVRFVTVRLTYIFIDYPDCEYIIILNTSIVIYDFLRLSVLRSSTPSMPIFGNRHRQKACLLTNTRMIHTHLFTINMILM
jgi:hypothetical protein